MHRGSGELELSCKPSLEATHHGCSIVNGARTSMRVCCELTKGGACNKTMPVTQRASLPPVMRAIPAYLAPAPEPPTCPGLSRLSRLCIPVRNEAYVIGFRALALPFWPQPHHRRHPSTIPLLRLPFDQLIPINPCHPGHPGAKRRRVATMGPKSRSAAPAPAAHTSTPAKTASSKAASQDAQDIIQGIWSNYLSKTPQRVKLLDSFMAFLVVVGALQFLYVVIVGNFVCLPLASGP